MGKNNICCGSKIAGKRRNILVVAYIAIFGILLLTTFTDSLFMDKQVEMEPKLFDIATTQTFTLEKLLKNAESKSVVIIFLNPKDLEEEKECQKLSLAVRNLYIQYGKIIEFLTIIQTSSDMLVENFSGAIPSCWMDNYPLWKHLIDLENRASKIYNITKTPTIITLDNKHQFVEKIEGPVSEQRLEVALVRIICSCIPSSFEHLGNH